MLKTPAEKYSENSLENGSYNDTKRENGKGDKKIERN
jgi:hypothetical protein